MLRGAILILLGLLVMILGAIGRPGSAIAAFMAPDYVQAQVPA